MIATILSSIGQKGIAVPNGQHTSIVTLQNTLWNLRITPESVGEFHTLCLCLYMKSQFQKPHKPILMLE